MATTAFAKSQPQIASPNTNPTPAQLAQKAKAQNVPEIPYESVPNFIKLPDNLYLGEGIGVATNSKGHVFAYTRSERTRLFEFDEKGTYVREIGEGLYGFLFAHAVRVDKDDNIWAVDEGSNMVIKFNPRGVMMLIGRLRKRSRARGQPARGTPPPNAQPYALAGPRRCVGYWQCLRFRRLHQLRASWPTWGKFLKSAARGAPRRGR
jgi:hypothetical protein